MADSQSCQRWKRDAKVALGAGVGTALLIGLGTLAVGSIGGGEARVLLEAMLPTSRFLSSAIMTASATILALMLTLLGMTVNAQRDIDPTYYHRVKQIAFYDMLTLTLATCFLVVHCIPVTKSDEIPSWWFPTAYYLLLGTSAVLGGALVSIVAMIYTTLQDVIHLLGIEDAEAA